MTVKIHRRQWIITKRSQSPELGTDFRSMELGLGTYLHYESSLSIRRIENAHGTTVILGILVGHDPDRNCGRFAAISFPWLSVDATGAMGVFYFKRPSTVICSSSTSLVQAVSGDRAIGRHLRWGHGINWDPPPSARIRGLRKLYCDQVLNLATGKVAQRTVPCEIAVQVRENSTKEALAQYLNRTVQQLAGMGRPIFLGLTAGRDSRTIFSALLAAGVPFQAFTLLRGRTGTTDARIAAELCKAYEIQHELLKPSETRKVEELEKLKIHTAGAEGDAGQEDVLGDYYRDMPDDAIVLHGGVFELGRRYYESCFACVKFESSREAADGIADAFSERSSSVLAPLRAWHRYRQKNPIKGMDFVDMFYLDQRRGGWGASNQQAQDAFGPEQVLVANSWMAIGLLMSPPLPARRTAEVQMQAIELLAPGITTLVPINPMTLGAKVRSTLVVIVARWPKVVKELRALRRWLRRSI
jgi:hypothetical protein